MLFYREANPLASLASFNLLYLNDKFVPHPIERAKEQRFPSQLEITLWRRPNVTRTS